ncbi:MAG: alpha/beta hydrolase [Terracidiphilus sp.]|jgi:endo-1,4-beta-xylanase
MKAIMHFPILLSLFTLVPGGASSLAQVPDPIYLWPQGAPGSEGKTAPESTRLSADGEHIISSINRPAILPYLPDKGSTTGAVVLVIPGGGHRELWMDHEGYNVASWLSHHGVAAFVLKYRLAKEPGSTYTVEGTELNDTQRALRLIRSRAAKWGIDPNRLGVMGFSAGGELAALASTRYDEGNMGAADPIDHESSRPAFQALIYPAIPSAMKLSKDTPPAFLACGEADRDDIANGVPELYLALRKEGVSAELHVYARTGHGFGLRQSNHGPAAGWIDQFYGWLDVQGFLKYQ